MAQETSTELLRHGAKTGSKNHRDTCLTGLFAALRTLKKFEEDDDKEYHVQDEKDNELSPLNCISRGHSLGTLLRGPRVVRLKRRILGNYTLEHLKTLQWQHDTFHKDRARSPSRTTSRRWALETAS